MILHNVSFYCPHVYIILEIKYKSNLYIDHGDSVQMLTHITSLV